MPSSQPHVDPASVEVLEVSPRGLWLRVRDREYFLDSTNFPWFVTASVRDVYQVTLEHGHIVRWPALDVDLELESLTAPVLWPLVAKR